MTIENKIRVLAGSMVLISVIFAVLFSEWWLFLTGFIGVNLIQSAFTGFCLPEIILRNYEKKHNNSEEEKIKIEEAKSE